MELRYWWQHGNVDNNITMELMFAGVNMFFALLSLKNFNSIIIIIWKHSEIKGIDGTISDISNAASVASAFILLLLFFFFLYNKAFIVA